MSMSEPTPNDRDSLVQKLLKRKLGVYATWTKPAVSRTVGPFDMSPFERFALARQVVADACSVKLNTYSDDDLMILCNDDAARSSRPPLYTEWNRFQNDELLRINSQEPPWYAAGFGHPKHVADLDYWGKTGRLSVAELTCLSIGIEPKEFALLEGRAITKRATGILLGPLAFFVRRLEQFSRQFSFNPEIQHSPSRFLAWSNSVELEVHPEFQKLLIRYHGTRELKAAALEDTHSVDRRELVSVARIITVLAIDNLGYQPTEAKSPIPKQIADLAAEHGINLSVETVRKYLKMGAAPSSDSLTMPNPTRK